MLHMNLLGRISTPIKWKISTKKWHVVWADNRNDGNERDGKRKLLQYQWWLHWLRHETDWLTHSFSIKTNGFTYHENELTFYKEEGRLVIWSLKLRFFNKMNQFLSYWLSLLQKIFQVFLFQRKNGHTQFIGRIILSEIRISKVTMEYRKQRFTVKKFEEHWTKST